MSTAKALTRISVESGALHVTWEDATEHFFHYFWLRESCYCSECGDARTGHRFLLPSDVALDVRAESAELVDGGNVLVKWAPDGHVSRYTAGWLFSHRYDDKARRERFHQPQVWDASVAPALPRVAFDTVCRDEFEHLGLLRKLRDYGFVIIGDGPRGDDAVSTIGELIGDLSAATYGTVVEITPLDKPVTLADTLAAQAPHTDEGFRHSPPGIIVFYCEHPASDGGKTILVDGFHLANELRRTRPEVFHLLSNEPLTFSRIDEKAGIHLRSRARVFTLNENAEIAGVRYSTRSAAPLDTTPERMRELHTARRELTRLMTTRENQLVLSLEPGDSVVFDNHRVLHGRTAFTDTRRHVRQCNVTREQFHERLRTQALRLGFEAEANQILSAGALG